MAFWGVEVKPGKPFTHKYDDSKGRLHISMATLGFGNATAKSTLQCNVGNRSPVYLCSLYPGNTESLQLNLEFEEVDNVIFSVIGPRSIHLCGYYLGHGWNTNINDSLESYGEDIADTETERSICSDEDEYEDSFIDDDGDPEVFPPSPVFNEEEASHDNRSGGKKSSLRRLRRKYQSIESDDDGCFEDKKIVNDSMSDQAEEIDGEDCLPISSFYKKKASGRVLDPEIDEATDRGASDASNKNGENGCNSILETNLKIDNALVDSETHREAELSDCLGEPSSAQDAAHVKKLKKKKKGKEQEVKSYCNDQTIKLDNAMQDVPKMNKKAQDLLTGDEQNVEHADDKEIETMDKIPSSEVGHGQVEKPKKKRKGTEEGMYLVSNGAYDVNIDNLSQRNEHSKQQLINEEVDNVAHEDGNQSEDRKVKKRNKKRSQGNVEVVSSESPQLSLKQISGAVEEDSRVVDNVAQDLPDGNQSEVRKFKKSKKKGNQGNVEVVNSERPQLSLEQIIGTVEEDSRVVENVAQDLPDGNQYEVRKFKKSKKKGSQGNVEVVSSEMPQLSLEQISGAVKEDSRGVDNVAQDFPDENQSEVRKFKKSKKKGSRGNVEVVCSEMPQLSLEQISGAVEEDSRGVTNVAQDCPDGNQSEVRKIKKSKKKRSQGNVAVVSSEMPHIAVEQSSGTVKEGVNKRPDAKPSQVRTLTNGLVIEELEMGTKDGKIAESGRKISVHYIGKLKKGGTVFESNAGQAPFKFCLGKGEVIKGWDVGLEGMRVGEKRRLVIPPSMASASEGHNSNIPPNSWLVYDIELVKVH